MNFDENGRLVVKTCACGVSELSDILIHSNRIKHVFGERDIVLVPSILSIRCSQRYKAQYSNINRQDCLSYEGGK